MVCGAAKLRDVRCVLATNTSQMPLAWYSMGMLAKTLQELLDGKLTTAKELGELAGVSTSTVYRWIAGQSQPDFDSIRLLVRHLPEPRAQEAILMAFTAGTDWQCTHMQLELDVNDDGRVDADDALDASIDAVKAASDSLNRVRVAHRGEILSGDETIQLIGKLNQVVRQCTITQRVLIELNEKRQNRRLKLAK